VPSSYWIWPVVAVALAAVGVALYALQAVRKRDQTIRRQLAREASLKARFDDLFERASDIMVVHDRRGRLSTINRAGEQALGYSREEVRLLEPNCIFGNDYIDAINRMIADGTDSRPQSFRSGLARRRGLRVPVDVDARVLVDDGQVVGAIAIARDLTERDRFEHQLRQAQKMEAVGRLAAGIAHDFNNLITVLIGYSDELLEHVPPDSEARYLAESVRRAADRAAALTQQLLASSRRENAVADSVDPNRVIAGTVTGEGVVLLAEDDASVRRLVVAELTKRGFTVIEAEDGRAALEIFRREHDRIDILVSDVVMPHLNGAELGKEVERLRPGTRVLFVSGHPERSGQGLDPAGVTNLLMKPFTADTLASRIKELMAAPKETDGRSA
jgi:PAS domain S-box-containing protein